MVKMSENSLTINKYILLIIVTVLTGGGALTGYNNRPEKAVTKLEIQDLLHTQFLPLNYKINIIDTRTQVIEVLQKELARRIEILEKSHD